MKKIFDKCHKNNILFDYECNREGFAFVFKRNVVNIVVNEKLSKDEENVLSILKKCPNYSALSISKLIDKSERSVQRILKSLKDKKYIDHFGTTRGYWKIVK